MLGKAFLLFAGVLAFLVPAFLAQTPPDGGTREVLISIFIPPLADAPFTATVNTEWVRPLGDGTRITLQNHRLIARDKRGRIFQERRSLVPASGKGASVLTQTEISDPVSRGRYICVPKELVCQLEELTAEPPPTASKKVNSPEYESLGKKWIAGLETIGSRQTGVIPANEVGNDSPIHTSREFWYSAQLGLNILSIRDDPRFGTERFELSDVLLGDPDATLFAPPEGSKILDLRTAEAPSKN
jgi:hypothetical protein